MKKNYYKIQNVKRGWTKIPNAIRHDEKLTSDAKVVIEELLSVSGDFQIYEAGIANALHLSLVRVKNAIKLLKSEGYIQLTKVKDGSHFGGWEWGISDTSGTFRTVENRTIGNRKVGNAVNPNENSERSEIELSETRPIGNQPIYQNTERYQETNHQEMNYQGQNENQLPHQPDAVVEEVSLPPYSGNSSWESSSEANASPLSSKTPAPSTQKSGVVSQQEFEFQQFLKKYPKKPTGTDMAATKQAFLEATAIDGSYAEIMAGLDAWCESVDWTKEGGRYITKPLHFLTTRKWEEVPRTIKTEIDPGLWRFIRPRDVEDYI